MAKLHPPAPNPQDRARRDNENQAVYRAYLRRSGRRRKRTNAADDQLWREAEREARPVRAAGFFLPTPSGPPQR